MTQTSKRGFAAMSPDRRREIARKGGLSVPSEKRSFSQDRELAASAGQRGGRASQGGQKSPPPPPQRKAGTSLSSLAAE